MTSEVNVRLWFAAGDYAAGALTGAVVAGAVRLTVDPGLDMVLAMLIGMAVGMIVHALVAAVLSPLLGFFHLMVPGSLIGMYGGMAFAMRDTMQHPASGAGEAAWVGAIFGVAIVGVVRLYDRALRPPKASGATGE